ncbi:MAG: protein kinase domain-containing protein [Myxococcales bacterium]
MSIDMMNMAQPMAGIGTYYGKYFLLEKLATGGMGEVFLARQQGPAGFEKILVVKKILNHLTENKEFVELFLGEARLAARMNHRNIVQVFELGEHEGTYFIAMEYVAGKSLREVIDAAQKRHERIPPEIARSIAEQICDGASYAHNLTDITGRSLNIIHRDLNPQNVLLSFGGDVKVIDFGIAKSEISTVKTEAGMIKGKFVYMSPEQSLAKDLDKRSDVFAIGITLYEMLTGQNPFHKSNIVLTLEAIQRSEPQPPSEWDPSLAPFDPILAKALDKDRERRYADASEMQEDLRRIVLPRAPERLSAFLARLFRSPPSGEEKALRDSDSWKITGSRAPSTPPKSAALYSDAAAYWPPRLATQAKPAPPASADASDSPTVLVSSPPKRDPGARGTARPSPRPPPPPPKKPVTGELARTEAPRAVVAEAAPPADTALQPSSVPEQPAPLADASATGEAAPPPDGEVTDRIRRGSRAVPRRRLSGQALWMAFGGGVLLSALAICGMVAWGMMDDQPAPRLRRTLLAGVARAEKPKPVPAAYGTLWLDARGGAVKFGGAAMPRQSRPYELPMTDEAGSVDVADVHLDYAHTRGALELRVTGSPGSIVWVNGAARGPSPIPAVKVEGQETLLEFRKTGAEPGPSLRVRYRER